MKDIRDGKMSIFGGPDDTGVSPSEGLALVTNQSEFNQLREFFLPTQPEGTTGFARRLNPEKFYIACRWNFSETSRAFLRETFVTVTNPANGKSAQAKPVDFGPSLATGRVTDLSPGLANHLGLETDQRCIVEIPLPSSDPDQPASPDPVLPPVDGLPLPSPFASRLATIAKQEFDQFGGTDEGQTPLRERIRNYYDFLGFDFESVEVPWSAVFISFCVKKAGAVSSEFDFSPEHSQFVFQAIQNAARGEGVFRGFDFTTQSVRVGDILHSNRPSGTFDFDFAAAHRDYPSHSAIVVARGIDHNGKFAMTVGGNERNTVGLRRVTLNASGVAVQRSDEKFISIIKDLK